MPALWIKHHLPDRLRSGQALDLSCCPRTPQGYYVMDAFIAGVDYCDAQREAWIWSIGREQGTGVILASKGNVFYQHDNFE